MDTWLVFTTTKALRGGAVGTESARTLQGELAARAGTSGQPGVDPEVTLTDAGTARVRQCFPMVDAFTASQLARDSLRGLVQPGNVEAIEVVRLADWLRTQD
ncbi:hypothetical protein ACIRF8_12865 [Streptomyces sp. NPDC102406]|uniref:hypothetical protein n=1 Tax=Streptomyces sp. NPDC102406 TaxID=3366171 RepID=UPI0037F40C5D